MYCRVPRRVCCTTVPAENHYTSTFTRYYPRVNYLFTIVTSYTCLLVSTTCPSYSKNQITESPRPVESVADDVQRLRRWTVSDVVVRKHYGENDGNARVKRIPDTNRFFVGKSFYVGVFSRSRSRLCEGRGRPK